MTKFGLCNKNTEFFLCQDRETTQARGKKISLKFEKWGLIHLDEHRSKENGKTGSRITL